MKRGMCVLLAVTAAAALASPAPAQTLMPYGVVGSGGGRSAGSAHAVRGTVGEACVGAVQGLSYASEVGYWYMPGWVLTGVATPATPLRNWLGQNYPNPFNPATTLEFSLGERTRVVLKLYDVSGREVMTLLDQELEPGIHREVIRGEGLSSGVYFARMIAGTFAETRTLVLLK